MPTSSPTPIYDQLVGQVSDTTSQLLGGATASSSPSPSSTSSTSTGSSGSGLLGSALGN